VKDSHKQANLDLQADQKPSGPVECLGLEFFDDEARRAHFLEKLAEKLKDPEFRKIEGFPIGEDEDILALSDPPYYTACPNPWLADFVKHYGKPYNPKDKYHREPFAADVSEGKNNPIYNAHSYHTKVPHKAIMRFLLHYTEPGDVVLDSFCGTGMTGVAAGLCTQHTSIRDLGYRVDKDGCVHDQNGKMISRIGQRYAVLSDLSPAATQIASNYNSPVDIDDFEREARRILEEVDHECGWMFKTTHSKGARDAAINFTVWSDVFVCPECAQEIIFFNAAVDRKTKKVKKAFTCPDCAASLGKRGMEHARVTTFDPILGQTVTQSKRVPVLINYSVGVRTLEKAPDSDDAAILARIDPKNIPYWFPTNRMLEGQETRRNDPIGLTHVHHFYTPRSLWVLSALLSKTEQIKCHRTRAMCRFLFEQWAIGFSLLNRYSPHHYSQNNRNLSGTLYVGSQIAEVSPSYALEGKLRRLVKAFQSWSNYTGSIATQSSEMLPLQNDSIDYIFVDPPFGANLNYSELNFLWESWFRVTTMNASEAIENKAQHKTREDYRRLMSTCFRDCFRILKPGRWMTVEFSNTSSEIWNAIQTALQEAGFVVANVAALDKQQGTFKAVTTPTAVKQDLVISAYKPNGGLEARFSKSAETDVGVWDFVRTHLNNLPVTRPRGGQLEPIAERDPRILFDRTVAFYVQHGIPVPIPSPEFQSGLADKFPERDGMYFLPDQAAEYDKIRMKMEGLGQLTIFVEDERSAVDWLRNYLKNKPSKYQDIQPDFFEQLNQSWKKWETKPELRSLLDQYFLCYHAEGNVPSQIHSHLSTNFKELRNLPADHAMLKANARDRWYVPDPKNQVQVEQLLEKRLLEEFWSYLPPGYEAAARRKGAGAPVLPGMDQFKVKLPKGKRLAIVRIEAVRVGFYHCFGRNDYATIIAVAQYIPEDVIQNNEQLQMIYDSAMTRTETAPE